MAGFTGEIVYGINGDFSTAGSLKGLIGNGLNTNGQMWIGRTAVNAGGTHISVGTIVSPLGTLTIGYSAPNITLDLTGGATAIEKINLQTGTTPIVPTAGAITFNGAVVAAGVNPIRTNGTGASTVALEVQTSQALAAADATKIGLCNFDSSSFSVSATGFVTLAGGSEAVDSFSPDSGTDPVVPTAAGLINDKGSGSITTVGSLNTITTQLTGLTNHAVLVGAGTTTITKLGVGTNGQVLIGATTADPAFATLTSSDSSISFTIGANTLSLQVAGGTTVGKTITGDSGGALSPTAGNWNLLGSGSIATSGSGSTLTTALTGLTNHAVLVGAGTSTITKLSVGATGTVLQGATGADPAFTATPTVTSITFGSGSALANYVTAGTWTPTIDGAVSGTTTYITQTGTYTRIGNIIVVQCLLQISAATGTGDVRIGGFPFNFNGVASTASTQWGGVWTWPVGRTSLNLEGQNGTAYCNAKTSGTGVTSANMQMANAALTLAFSLVYLA